MKSSLAAYLLRRLLAAIALVLAVSLGALILEHFVPGEATGDVIRNAEDRRAVAAERARLGLDRPLLGQIGGWLWAVAHLDLGTSSQYRRPVVDLVRERSVWSAELAAAALGLAIVIGVPLGLVTGARPRGVLAALVSPLSIALVSCPPIVGALALTLLALRTGLMSVTPGSLAVPLLALALPLAAMIERLQARATAETLAAPSLLAAASRGIPPWRLLWIHAARQSLRPVLGVFGILIASVFGNSLAVEYIAAWPGLARLMYDALVARDLFLVVGCALVGAIFLAAGNFVADVARALVDPRVREQ